MKLGELFDVNGENTYTMIAAATQDGFILGACELIRRSKKAGEDNPYKGTVDADRFVVYVELLLNPHLGNYDLGENNSIVVMDNATVHSDPRIEALINARGSRLVYLPKYSPEYNPIEKCFFEYKSYLRRHSRYSVCKASTHIDRCTSLSAEEEHGELLPRNGLLFTHS